MHRFQINPENIRNKKFRLDDDGSINKIRQVLRMEKGDRLNLFTGEGEEFTAEILVLKKDGIEGVIIEEASSTVKEKSGFVLAQAFTKGSKMDDIIRMNTEVGIGKFLFFESAYSVIKLKDFNPKKLDRWNRVATEASRQSERTVIPTLSPPVSFENALDTNVDIKLVLHSRNVAGAKDIHEVRNVVKDKSVQLMIGPEGGFSDKELEQAQSKGFEIVFMNLPVLRTETAGVVASGILLS